MSIYSIACPTFCPTKSYIIIIIIKLIYLEKMQIVDEKLLNIEQVGWYYIPIALVLELN